MISIFIIVFQIFWSSEIFSIWISWLLDYVYIYISFHRFYVFLLNNFYYDEVDLDSYYSIFVITRRSQANRRQRCSLKQVFVICRSASLQNWISLSLRTFLSPRSNFSTAFPFYSEPSFASSMTISKPARSVPFLYCSTATTLKSCFTRCSLILVKLLPFTSTRFWYSSNRHLGRRPWEDLANLTRGHCYYPSSTIHFFLSL